MTGARPSSSQHQAHSGTNVEIDERTAPALRDLAETLLFSPNDGRIWFGEQRLVMLHSAALGVLRRELIACMGQEQARSILTRVAYSTGTREAERMRQVKPDSDLADIFSTGARILRLAGLIRPETEHFEFDVDRGNFFAELHLRDSHEDDEQIANYGIGNEPACWMQIGYASGYASAFMGKMIVYRELDCRSSGAEFCRFVGRPVEEWDNVEEDLRYLQPQTSANLIRRTLVPVEADISQLPTASAKTAKAEEPDPLTSDLIGISTAFSTARHLIERVAPTQATVLFTGASGVGKERFAQALHAISPRAREPFIAINCAAIPDTLIESELFGVERGAFTGASTSRPGRFERAENGTLFLDEIASLSFVAQGKLLRALQERRIERVGGTKVIPVNVRVVAATNVELRDEVAEGRFREDLYFRLNVFPITLPPLKERRDDIPLLMEAFRKQFSDLYQRKIPGFTPRAVKTLLQYEFPGNIRELQNLVERGVIMANPSEPIDVHHMFRTGELNETATALALGENGRLTSLTATNQNEATTRPAKQNFRQAEAEHVNSDEGLSYRQALVANRYNVSAAARELGLTRAQLAYRLKRLGLL